MTKLQEVREFAKKAHAGQLYDGKDYFTTHVLDVALRVGNDPRATDEHVMAALLHDVLEDNKDLYIEDLQELLGPEYPRVVYAVFKLTKADNETYEQYMAQLVQDPIATLVKFHDSSANFEYGGRKKYAKNMEYLTKFLPPIK